MPPAGQASQGASPRPAEAILMSYHAEGRLLWFLRPTHHEGQATKKWESQARFQV